MRKKNIDIAKLRELVLRSNTGVLCSTVLLFQCAAMLLLAFKTEGAVDPQALTFAVGMPLCSLTVVKLFGRIWPIDRALLWLILFLLSVSVVTLKAIARSPITPGQQAEYILLGFLAMAFGILFVRHTRSWERWVWPLILLSLAASAAPYVFGKWENGAKNWLHIRALGRELSLQPSEIVKFTLIYVLAARFSGRASFGSCAVGLAFAAVLCGLLVLERDLGAVVLYFLTTIALYYAATANLPVTLLGLGTAAAGSVYAYKTMDLVRLRVAIYLNPWADATGTGYQLIQSLIAIGSGGLFGMGLGLGLPRVIPQYHNDFIFAAISEQYGMVFSIALIAIYVLILMRGLSIASNARTSFHALLAFGVVALIGLQTFVNIGGNIQLIPMTGVVLPFISAGGSSLVTMMGGAGLLLGVSSINANDEDNDLRRLEAREAAHHA